jgi:hypothetical protein
MNASNDTPPAGKKEPAQGKSRIGLYLLLIVLMGAAIVLAPIVRDRLEVKIVRTSPPGISVESIVQEAVSKPDRPAARSDRAQEALENLSEPPEKNREQASASKEELARLKGDIVTLSGAVESLQRQIKQSTQSAEKTHSASQTQLATTLAFTLVKAASMSRQGYARELAVLKKAAAEDGAVMASVQQIEPMATSGAPALPELRETFDGLAGSVQSALDRVEAKTWKDRLLAELKNLISIRNTNENGEGNNAVEAIHNDLVQGNLKEALERSDKLPETARAPLKEWREKAEARLILDAVLNDIAAHLIGQTGEPS